MKNTKITVAAKKRADGKIEVYPVNKRVAAKLGLAVVPLEWSPKGRGNLRSGKIVRFRMWLKSFETWVLAGKERAQIHDVELAPKDRSFTDVMTPLAHQILQIIHHKCGSFCLDDETDARNCAVAIAGELERKGNPPRTIYRGSRVSHNIPHGGFQGGLVRPGGFGQVRRPPPVPRRSNPSMTYGTLPPIEMIESHIGSEGFYYELRGSDADAGRDAGIPLIVSEFSPLDAHAFRRVLLKLIEAWERGDEEAGSLASGFLSTIGIEWV